MRHNRRDGGGAQRTWEMGDEGPESWLAAFQRFSSLLAAGGSSGWESMRQERERGSRAWLVRLARTIADSHGGPGKRAETIGLPILSYGAWRKG